MLGAYLRDDPEYARLFGELCIESAARWQEAREKHSADYFRHIAAPALTRLYWQRLDMLGQRFGLPPMAFRA